jgi:hypothetical protein
MRGARTAVRTRISIRARDGVHISHALDGVGDPQPLP